MSENIFIFLWVALALTGTAILLHFWHLINQAFSSKEEPTVLNEEDNIP